MSLAGPPNYRRPLSLAWWQAFERILAGFFADRQALGPCVVDLGAGHFQLSDLARLRGSTVIGVEDDPALAALGRMSGHAVLEMNWNDLSRASIGATISGVFSKFSVSALRARCRSDVRALCRRIDGMVGRRGWGWIAPWNGPVGYLPRARAAELAECQAETFLGLGWQHVELTAAQAKHFGVFGSTFNRPLFLKRLPWRAPAETGADPDLTALGRAADAHGWLYAEHPLVARAVRSEADFSALMDGVLADVIRSGTTVLDMYPPYYDLAMNVGPRGASVISLERDRFRAARFRQHGYQVLATDAAGAARHLGRECLDGVFSWGHTGVERPDQWAHVASDLRAAASMLRRDGWGWVAVEHSRRATRGRALADLDAEIRPEGWELEPLPPEEAARLGFRRLDRLVTVVSRNCRPGPGAAPPRSTRPVWLIGGSPEREWMAAVFRQLGYANRVLLGGDDADRVDLAARGLVVWYVMGGVSAVPDETASAWMQHRPLPGDEVAVFPLADGTTAVVMNVAAADRFGGALDGLRRRLAAGVER
jgi:hypothetical protein